MTKPLKSTALQQDEHGDGKSISSQMRKRDKFRNMFRSPKPETHSKPLAARPEAKIYHTNFASTEDQDDQSSTSYSNTVSSSKSVTQPSTENAKVRLDIFSTNVAKPVARVAVPNLGARIDNTPQLALCSRLLPKSPVSSPSNESSLDLNFHRTEEATQDTIIDNAKYEWAMAIAENVTEQRHIRWLLARMIEEFVKDPVKGSAAVTEVVHLGPGLDCEHYRKLLNCFISEFEKAIILDVDLLQGLVQLVQCTSEGYLVADDLIKILSLLRTRLQQTNQQSTKHPYHLTLALSRLLDVMAMHKVKDLDRVEQHEPLGAVLSSLRESSDPFLMYQASYAFQALQCVPDDETVLQAIMRHSGALAESLIGVSGVVNLNLGGFLEGLGQLQKTIVDTIGIAKSAIEGAQSLIESGKGVFEALREGVSSGHKRAWYPAIIGATAFVREGRLADFKVVVMEATCRQSPEFQWGICQLLGEIAVDSMWESAVRRDAVDFLVELYTYDPDWGRDASVKTWILTILRIISENPEPSINGQAVILLQDIDSTETAMFAKPYPLQSHLPVPVVSPLLARVQEIPLVERDLDQLKAKRLRNRDQKVYIPPQAKASLQGSDKETKPLMDLIKEFLGSDRQVFLVLGDSGAGKSTFNRHLENELWKEYAVGGPIPLFINLPAVSAHYEDIIGQQLRIHKFSEAKIKELKEHRQMILICDGYDETQLNINLHTANLLNQEGQADTTKMIISCRSTYLGQDYRNLFQPQQSDRYSGIGASLYTEAVIVPFSSGQIEDYVDQFVQDPEVHKLIGGSRVWSTEVYMSTLRSIPNMMELVKNPFLLSLSLGALPDVVKDAVNLATVKVTRLTLFNSFIDQWLDINTRRLENITLSVEATRALKELFEEGFTSSAIDFLKSLAAAIFKEQDGNPIVQYTPRSDKGTWKFKFFGSEPDTILLRESSPLSRAGIQHRFMHRSLLEYFYSRHIHSSTGSLMPEGSRDITDHPLSQRNLVKEPSVIGFLAEYVQIDRGFKKHLHQILELSKTDANASQAAANAITTLIRAGVTFNGAELRGIKIPGADLNGGQFDSAQLQGADLSDTNLRNVWLRQADLTNAQMAGTQFGECPFIQEEHVVGGCAYSPDGKTLAVGLSNGTISLYNTATLEQTRTLSSNTFAISSVTFSSSGQQMAAGSADHAVRLWDAQTGASGSILSGHIDAVMSVAFSPCGQQIASGSCDKTVRLWNAHTGAPGTILIGHTDAVMSVAFSPNGQQIASGGDDKTVRIWDANTGASVALLSGHSDWVSSVVFSPSGQQIASGSGDETVRLWDAQSGAPGTILRGHTSKVTSVVFSPGGQQIASGSMDNTVRLWDAHTGVPGAILVGPTDWVMSVVFSPSGQHIASGSMDNAVRLWDAQAGAPDTILSGHTEKVRSVAFSPSGQQIASGSDDKTVRIWDAQTGESVATFSGHSDWVSSAVFSPNGQQIASGSGDETVRLWNAHTGIPSAIISGHSSKVTSVVFSPCGQQIASGHMDNTVRLWDAQTGAPGTILLGHIDWVTSVVFSPSGQQIAAGSMDYTVRIWNAQTGAPGATLCGHTGRVRSVAFSPNGQQIASGSDDRTVRLWDVQTGIPGIILSGHTGRVRTVVFSPSGLQVASGSDDKTVRLWDAESGQCRTVVKGFNGAIASIAWRATGKGDNFLVTGCFDTSVRVWKVTGDRHPVCLQWSSGRGQLSMADTIISNVQGLSRMNLKLLEQRGASDSPILLEE